MQKKKPAFISMGLSGGNSNPVQVIYAGSAVTGIYDGGGSEMDIQRYIIVPHQQPQ
jgi:hypothetical protein